MDVMFYSVTPYKAYNVSNRDKVEPVRNVARVEMNTYHSRNEYARANQNAGQNNARPKLNTQSFSPHFAVHILMEAGELNQDRTDDGIKAYNRRREIPKTTLIIA